MLKDFSDIALTVQKRKKIIPSVARARARAGAGSRGKMSEIEPPQNPGIHYPFLDAPCGDMTWMSVFLQGRKDVIYSGKYEAEILM